MVIYHVPGLSPSTHLHLNGKVLAQIFAGQITRWDDPAIKNLNPGVTLPGTAIVLVHRSDTSGSTVRSVPGAIGYVGVSYLSKVTQDNEGEAALGNSAGNFMLPTASTIQAGLASFTNTPANETMSLINGSGADVYPIINYEYAIVSISQASATLAQDLRAFLSWAISTGSAQLAQVNFQPLPPSVVMLSLAQIAKIKG